MHIHRVPSQKKLADRYLFNGIFAFLFIVDALAVTTKTFPPVTGLTTLTTTLRPFKVDTGVGSVTV